MLPQPVFDGELSYKFNLTSLTRQDAEFNAITQGAADQNLCVSNNPAVLTPNNCLLRGIAGTYTRASGDVDWRRTLYTNNGQVITPFLRVRGDVASLEAQNAPGMSNYINTGQSEPARFMPAAGVEYRYPFVDVEAWGTQTVEPIAQLILRPNETEIGKFPERGRAEPGVQHRQPVLDRQVFRLGPRRGRRPRQCRAAVHRPGEQGRLAHHAVRRILSDCTG